MRKYIKSNDGYALVIALLVITVVTVLGLGILTTTSSSKKLSEEENKDQTAYYIAEAGLNQKKEELKEIPNLYNEYIKNKDIEGMKEAEIITAFLEEIKKKPIKKPILNKETIYREGIFNRKNARANVKTVMTVSETELKFTITSTGIIKSNDSTNEKKRTVQSVDSYNLNISDNGKGFGEYTAYLSGSNNALSMRGGSSYIEGDIGFSAPPTGNFVKNFKHNGNVFFNASAPYKSFPEDKFKNFTFDTCTACQEFKSLKADSDTKLKNASKTKPVNRKTTIPTNELLEGDYVLSDTGITNGGLYTVASGKTIRIFMDEFPRNSNSLNLTFSGDGEIIFYVNNVSAESSLTLNFGNNDVTFFAKNDDIDLKLKGSVNITNAKSLSLYSHDDIEMEGSINFTNIKQLLLFANDDIDLNGSLNISKGEEINFLAAAVKKDGTEADDSSLDLEGSIAFYDAKRINFFAEEDIDLEGSLSILGTNFADTFNLCAKKEIEFENSYELDVKEIHAFAGKSIEFDPNNKLEEKNKKGIIIHRGTFELFTPDLKIKEFKTGYFNTKDPNKKSGPTNFYISNTVKLAYSNPSGKTYTPNFIFDNFNIYYGSSKGPIYLYNEQAKNNKDKEIPLHAQINSTINFDILNTFTINNLNNIFLKGVIVLRNYTSAIVLGENHRDSVHFYAPKAEISLNGNSAGNKLKTFSGAIGANKLTGNGNQNLHYSPPYPNSILKSSGSEGGNNGSISSDISKNPDGGSIEVNNP